MTDLLWLFVTLACVLGYNAQKIDNKTPIPGQPIDISPFDEIIVESSLNVRKKPVPARRSRSLLLELVKIPEQEILRLKRQIRRPYQPRPDFYNGGYGGYNNNGFQPGLNNFNNKYASSASTSNANAQSQGYNPYGFDNSAAQAQAQAFQAQGPLGGFGASAANSGTQSFLTSPFGLQGATGLSASQTYTLPNGQSINLAFTDNFSRGTNGQVANSNSNAITYS